MVGGMKAVIVAAGNGSRLRPLTLKTPKPLLPVLGKPLIVHVLDALAKVQVDEVAVVTGYLGSKVRRYLKPWVEQLGVKVHFVHNHEYERGNGVSLKVARKLIKREPFLLLMSDHIVDAEAIRLLLDEGEGTSLCVDRTPRFPPQVNDATKVLVDKENYIIDIGKEIPEWNGVDTGVFLCDPVVFDVASLLARERFTVTITDCMRWLIRNGRPIRAVDVSGFLWLDVDTPEDMEFAERILGGVEGASELGWDSVTLPQPENF
ncbi:MAG: phosphocholine cytidylyltransferase family protein [Candidatus Freyarchaeota archaeon]